MSVPVPEAGELDEPGLLDLAERFHDQHERERGFCFRNQQPLIRGVRLIGRGHTPKPERLAHVGTVTDPERARRGVRPAYFGPELIGSGFVEATVYDGGALGPGAEVRGPALVEEPFTVVVLPPGYRARVDDFGNYAVTVH
jgi:N-methylhydantoinase A